MSMMLWWAMIKGKIHAPVIKIPHSHHPTSERVVSPSSPLIRDAGMPPSSPKCNRSHEQMTMRDTNPSKTDTTGSTDSAVKHAAAVKQTPEAVKKANPSIMAMSHISPLVSKG
jgi:hypothetical protein